jgi:DNA repair exonuclease SbcCD nuclease subunit
MVVCGDAFESNQVDRKTVARALEALKDVPVPVYLLPGNHDPLNAASVYRSSIFLERKPAHVHVIENTAPIQTADGVEIVGAPWTSKRPVANPLEGALSTLSPASGVIRICMGHGAVDQLVPDRESSGVIILATADRAIKEKRVHFVALGDRHSLTTVGDSKRVWYSGTPESTDFSETRSGFALVVEIDEEHVATKEVRVGQWRFIERGNIDLNTAEDVEAIRKWLDEIDNKERSVIRMHLVGSLTLSLRSLLQNHLLAASDLLGALETREDDLLVVADDADFADLGFSGFAGGTVRRLRDRIAEGGKEGAAARDALLLLLRLARGTA